MYVDEGTAAQIVTSIKVRLGHHAQWQLEPSLGPFDIVICPLRDADHAREMFPDARVIALLLERTSAMELQMSAADDFVIFTSRHDMEGLLQHIHHVASRRRSPRLPGKEAA